MGCLTENVTNPYHDSTVFVLLTALLAAFIPWIVGSSALIVAAVTYVRQLNSPHNYFLGCVAITDFCIGVVAIPLYLAEDINKVETRKFLLCHLTLWQFMLFLRNCIQTTNGYFLTLLCLDSFIQLNFPVIYNNYSSKRTARIIILITTLINFTLTFVIFGFAVESGDSIIVYKDGFVFHLEGNIYLKYLQFSFLIPGTACVIVSIQVRMMALRHKGRKMDKITTWLSLSFIILYIPTILVVFLDKMLDQYDLINQIARIFRFGVSLTNGYVLYLTRPIYKVTFTYFLKTHPRKWRTIQYRRRKTTMFRPPIGFGSPFSPLTPTSQLSLSSLQIKYSMEFKGVESSLDNEASSSEVVGKPSTDNIECPTKIVKSAESSVKAGKPSTISLEHPTKVIKSTESSIKAVKPSKDNIESSIQVVKPAESSIKAVKPSKDNIEPVKPSKDKLFEGPRMGWSKIKNIASRSGL